jgi:hypothetical protein
MGAAINKVKLALLGQTVSLSNNFNPSAKGCNNPKIPTTLGPRRLCMEAITFLSYRVKYATASNKGTRISNIFKIFSI